MFLIIKTVRSFVNNAVQNHVLNLFITDKLPLEDKQDKQISLYKKRSFPLRISSTADLVTFTKEILNRKLHFLCSVWETTLFALF